MASSGIGPIKKGALHKQLGMPQGQKIPVSKLRELANSKNALTRRRANFALAARQWSHTGGKKK